MYDRSKDLIVVAMPLYGHAALALEALETLLASETVFRTQIVVSVDGDPRREVLIASRFMQQRIRISTSFSERMPGPVAHAIALLNTFWKKCPMSKRSISWMPTIGFIRTRSMRSTASFYRAALVGFTQISTRSRSTGALIMVTVTHG